MRCQMITQVLAPKPHLILCAMSFLFLCGSLCVCAEYKTGKSLHFIAPTEKAES